MRPIATDTHDFPKLRNKGCIYVDKTMFLHRMVSDVGTNLFFISRPRRFGKSLTVSALKALFSGRRELFEGLAIDKTDWTWEKYPIIHFEFNDLTTSSVEAFEKDLADHLLGGFRSRGSCLLRSADGSRLFGAACAVAEGERIWRRFVASQDVQVRHRNIP